MHIEDFNAIKNRCEPEASAGDDGEFLLISCAVSLKRIADALEQQGNIAATAAAYAPATHDLRGESLEN